MRVRLAVREVQKPLEDHVRCESGSWSQGSDCIRDIYFTISILIRPIQNIKKICKKKK